MSWTSTWNMPAMLTSLSPGPTTYVNGGAVSSTVGAGVGVKRGPGVEVAAGADGDAQLQPLALGAGVGEANATGAGTARMLATTQAVNRPPATARIRTTTTATTQPATPAEDRRGEADGDEAGRGDGAAAPG